MMLDWRTLALQAVNVLVLVWLLQKFFWRPVAAMIEQRRVAAKTLLDEAAQKRGEAAAGLAEIAKTRAGFAREREAALAGAASEVAQARAVSAEEARTASQAMEADARARIAAARAAAETAWRQNATQLAIDIAGRLAARLQGEAVRAAFLDWLLSEIAALPEAVRREVAAGEATLEAISAAELGFAEQERHAGLIAQAFGGEAKIAFKTDAALIAGLELRSKNFLLRNSWRADLDRILEGIGHEP